MSVWPSVCVSPSWNSASFQGYPRLSLHALPLALLQFHELAWSSKSLYAVKLTCTQFHIVLSDQLTRTSQCLLFSGLNKWFVFGNTEQKFCFTRDQFQEDLTDKNIVLKKLIFLSKGKSFHNLNSCKLFTDWWYLCRTEGAVWRLLTEAPGILFWQIASKLWRYSGTL